MAAPTPAANFDNLNVKKEEAQRTTAVNLTTGQAISTVLSNVTVATAAGTGTATALPATPAGYFEVISPAGNVVKIPFFN